MGARSVWELMLPEGGALSAHGWLGEVAPLSRRGSPDPLSRWAGIWAPGWEAAGLEKLPCLGALLLTRQ